MVFLDKLFQSKKGFSGGLKLIAGIIVIIASFFLILSLTGTLSKVSKDTSEGTLCYTTLGVQTVSSTITFDMATIQNACRTIPHTLKVGKGDEERVMRYLADKMARTWWMVHEGTIDDVWDKFGFFTDSSCKIIYVIAIKERSNFFRTNNALNISAQVFQDYLNNTVYLPKQLTNETYVQYLEEHNNLRLWVLPKYGNDIQTIQSGETYAIFLINHVHKAGKWNKPNSLYLSSLDYAENTLGCEYAG